MVDIQFATAEIRRGKRKKKERGRKKEEETTGQKYNDLPYWAAIMNRATLLTIDVHSAPPAARSFIASKAANTNRILTSFMETFTLLEGSR